MADVKQHYADPTRPYPDDDGSLTSELNIFLEWCGMAQPLDRIYITTRSLPSISYVLLLAVISQFPKIHYAKSLGKLFVSSELVNKTEYCILILPISYQN